MKLEQLQFGGGIAQSYAQIPRVGRIAIQMRMLRSFELIPALHHRPLLQRSHGVGHTAVSVLFENLRRRGRRETIDVKHSWLLQAFAGARGIEGLRRVFAMRVEILEQGHQSRASNARSSLAEVDSVTAAGAVQRLNENTEAQGKCHHFLLPSHSNTVLVYTTKTNNLLFFRSQWKSFYAKEPIVKMENYGNVTLCIGNGYICLECGDDFQEENHIASMTKCFRCKYQTVCSRAILEHVSSCVEVNDKSTSSPLDKRMFCICGFASEDGNELANHLAQCDKKSAYDSPDAALANTVKCNMLDMLDLMPRDGVDDDDSSDNLLIPADQQQQLLSKSIDRAGKASAADDDEEMTKGQAPSAIDDFNTQLSLDDLAPASVAPQNEQDDRTPTLSDEYQVTSLLISVAHTIRVNLIFVSL